MNEKIVKALGSVAAVAAIVMYVSYIPQIIGNLHGNRGLYTTARGCDQLHIMGWLWLTEKERDWPIAIANLPGVVFGLMAFLTALIPF